MIQKEIKIKWYNEYINGSLVSDIAKKYNCGKTVVYKELKKNGIGGDRICYSLNESSFDNLNENSEYWIGFLFADGHIREKDSNNIILNISEKDLEHIENFKSFLQSNHKIHIRKINNKFSCCRISVHSDKLANRLFYYGYSKKGSLFHKPSKELTSSRHFWRGVIDGDGCITKDKRCGSLVLDLLGGYDLILLYKKYIQEVLLFDCKIEQDKNKSNDLFRIRIGYSKATKACYHFYQNCESYLDRKCTLALGF